MCIQEEFQMDIESVCMPVSDCALWAVSRRFHTAGVRRYLLQSPPVLATVPNLQEWWAVLNCPTMCIRLDTWMDRYGH